eukprot:2137338-Rhodomonas_salina.2
MRVTSDAVAAVCVWLSLLTSRSSPPRALHSSTAESPRFPTTSLCAGVSTATAAVHPKSTGTLRVSPLAPSRETEKAVPAALSLYRYLAPPEACVCFEGKEAGRCASITAALRAFIKLCMHKSGCSSQGTSLVMCAANASLAFVAATSPKAECPSKTAA